MSEKLHESGFLTTDLQALFANVKSAKPNEAVSNVTEEAPQEVLAEDTVTEASIETDAVKTGTGTSKALPPKGDWKAWGELLNKRLAYNNRKTPDKKKASYDVETDFFKDFYENNWAKEIADRLKSIGEPLRKAIKVLGFNPKKEPGGNPLLAFIIQPYVQKELLLPGLLNVLTFKAIYNAVAEKSVADYEFFMSNDYNIIYCKDLYKKSVTEMAKYIKAQTHILSPVKYEYAEETKNKNKKCFFCMPKVKEISDENKEFELPSATSPNTTLNSLTLAKEIIGIRTEADGTDTNINLRGTKNINKLAAKIAGNLAQIFATIQYFSAATDLPEAKKALGNERFQTLTGSQIAKATAYVAPLLSKENMPDDEVKNLISILLGNLK